MRSADGRRSRIRSGPPDGIPAFAVLHAAAAATSVAESAGQQQNYDDDEEDREHGHLPKLSLGRLFEPNRLSARRARCRGMGERWLATSGLSA